ncbi:MAG: DUF1800 family protein [Planctomycetota bacterium]
MRSRSFGRGWRPLLGSLILCVLAVPLAWAGPPEFRRGDFDTDGGLSISDAVQLLGYLFLAGTASPCADAADVDDNGAINLADAVSLLQYLFASGSAPPAPGPLLCGPDPTGDTLGCNTYDCGATPTDPLMQRIGHVLNRVAYGPTATEVGQIQATGLTAYIEQQLDPASIDEASNSALMAREDAIISEQVLTTETILLADDEFWRYFKGQVAPPADWTQLSFDDSTWLQGQTGIGYGNDDDRTEITDMQGNYWSLFFRREVFIANPAALSEIVLRLDYDDGMVTYVNGVEVARGNMGGTPGVPPAFDAPAPQNHSSGFPEDFVIPTSAFQAGTNVIAVEVHNNTLASVDFTFIPILSERTALPLPPRPVVPDLDALQKLVHVRGVYARRQLQNVLAEFWENHFTTDYDKTAAYLSELENPTGGPAMNESQARFEAANVEWEEYEFFRENALGNFGDLLLYSATSPSMLIYLDNVSNLAQQPNENYAREILELFAMGVDNGYDQTDIVQLAKCFTGWTVSKVGPLQAQGFPNSATNPPITDAFQIADIAHIEIGDTWKYFKGTTEPSPGVGGAPTLDWTLPGFDTTTWLNGPTGIGFGDGDDATEILDMQGNYASLYMRYDFTIPDLNAIENLLFEMAYDDGFVAYLNGVEIARSDSMKNAGPIPPSTTTTSEAHEATLDTFVAPLNAYRFLLTPGTNVLAIQVHNRTLTSNDLSALPRLIDRTLAPGSVLYGDRSGVWTFRFDPSQHDTGAKVVFENTPYETNIPAGRLGVDGVLDAIDVINTLVAHPSTAEFISLKLINRFVSDEITLSTFDDQSAPLALRSLLADALAAWYSTSPPGNIETVMRAILDPTTQQGAFWNPQYFSAKVKTPVEFINSSLRVLGATASGQDLPALNSRMGMHLFDRDEPDGWPEAGGNWVDSGTMLERINFARRLAANEDSDYNWSTLAFLTANGATAAAEIVDLFDDLMFQGNLSLSNKSLLLEFVETNNSGQPQALDPAATDYAQRVRNLVGLLLSMPQWHFQ